MTSFSEDLIFQSLNELCVLATMMPGSLDRRLQLAQQVGEAIQAELDRSTAGMVPHFDVVARMVCDRHTGVCVLMLFFII